MPPASAGSPPLARRLSRRDIVHTVQLMVACLLSYLATTHLVGPFVSREKRLLGGMWAVVATIFVFKDCEGVTVLAALSRLSGTGVSFVLCSAYLLLLPSNVLGVVLLIGLGAFAMIALGRRQDLVTTGITTSVVMVVAAIDPFRAWHQPLLRLIDTLIGTVIAVLCSRVGAQDRE